MFSVTSDVPVHCCTGNICLHVVIITKSCFDDVDYVARILVLDHSCKNRFRNKEN